MTITHVKRVTHLGLVNFWRNRWLSLASIAVLTLTLITISISIIQNIDITKTIESIQDRLDMRVYFDDKVTEPEIKDLQLKLESRPDIKSVQYISKEEALEIWRGRPTKDNVKNLVTPEDNPLPRSLLIKTEAPESLEQIAAVLTNYPSLEGKINLSYGDNQPIIDDFIVRNKTVQKTGLISSLTFVIISLVVIVNTIRTIILSRREEIEIMRLVGASDFYVRTPILVEAIITAVLAALLSTAFLIIGVYFNVPIIPFFVSNFFSDLSSSTIKDLLVANLPVIFVLQLIGAFLLTICTTFVSMRRYLKG